MSSKSQADQANSAPESLHLRVLVLGGTGMLGHKLAQVLLRNCERDSRESFDVAVTTRGPASAFEGHPVLGTMQRLGGVRAEDLDSVTRAVADFRPDAVLNAIGLVKQDPRARDPLEAIRVNALFPHRLAQLCRASGARLIHFSTDCVFSGRRGHYRESDPPDPRDLYGRAKLLGEVDEEGCLTLRTSIVGRELRGGRGLLEWFLSHAEAERVHGYTRAVFSGLTTRALAERVVHLLRRHPALSGVWHVASEPVSKHELLCRFRDAFDLRIEIEPDERVVCDRSLDARRIEAATGLPRPTWDEMIEDLRRDPTPYAEIRQREQRPDEM